VEELLAGSGVLVACETVRRWCRKSGQTWANDLRRCRPRPGDEWHLGEMFASINGVQHHLWCAVAQDGNVADILAQRRRSRAVATTRGTFLTGRRDVPRVEHRRRRGLNNWAGNSRQPARARRMRRFKSPGHARRFLAATV
jgi:putative transposase